MIQAIQGLIADRPAYYLPDEEVKAVQVLYRAIQEHPQSYPLLHVQCDFLRNKVRMSGAS